jgi:hypothetical protein
MIYKGNALHAQDVRPLALPEVARTRMPEAMDLLVGDMAHELTPPPRMDADILLDIEAACSKARWLTYDNPQRNMLDETQRMWVAELLRRLVGEVGR